MEAVAKRGYGGCRGQALGVSLTGGKHLEDCGAKFCKGGTDQGPQRLAGCAIVPHVHVCTASMLKRAEEERLQQEHLAKREGWQSQERAAGLEAYKALEVWGRYSLCDP